MTSKIEFLCTMHPHHADRIREGFSVGLSIHETLADLAAFDAHQALMVARSTVAKANRVEVMMVEACK